MKCLNLRYEGKEALARFLEANGVQNGPGILVQLFSGVCDPETLKETASAVNGLLPRAVVIGTTTAGEVLDGRLEEGSVVLSVALFRETRLRAALYRGEELEKAGEKVARELVDDDTQVLLLFSDGAHLEGEGILAAMERERPEVTVAGGKAGDNFAFRQSWVSLGAETTDHGAVAVALSGAGLKVLTGAMLNWQKIGRRLTVTLAEGGRVYAIDHRPTVEIYRHYLGDEVASRLPEWGIEFPLVLERNGRDVARGPIARFDDGSLLFAGEIRTGDRVRFGFGSPELVRAGAREELERLGEVAAEAIFVYSCSARKMFLGRDLEVEFAPMAGAAPTAGFITYGEFFHAGGANQLLNITTTYLALGESDRKPEPLAFDWERYPYRNKALRILTHLSNVVAGELEEERRMFEEGGVVAFRWENREGWPVEHVSPNVDDLLGYDAEAFTSGRVSYASLVHPEDLDRVGREVAGAISAGSLHLEHEPYRLQHRDGRILWVYDHTVVVRNEGGEAVRFLGYLVDVTRQKENEAQLEAINRELEERVRRQLEESRRKDHLLIQQSRLAAMEEMIGNIAHQWRQPLNAAGLILQSIGIAGKQGTLTPEKLEKQVDRGMGLVRQMSETIDDFRNFFRPDKKKSLFSLEEKVEETLSLMEGSFRFHHIAPETDLASGVRVLGFPGEFSQALLNLLSNARDQLSETGAKVPRVRVALYTEGTWAVVTVEDNGGGIPEEILAKVFDPYFTTKEEGKGTGIGLYMSKTIADAMDGGLTAANGAEGALFTLRLPLAVDTSTETKTEKD